MSTYNGNLDISVLTSVYKGDRPEWLYAALESCLKNQVGRPKQLVLVVDGVLTSDLESVVSDFQDLFSEQMDVIRLVHNQGLAHALNVGLQHCKYELVARMDADDVCFKERFTAQESFFSKHPNLDILGSEAIEIDNAGREARYRRVPATHNDIYKLMWTCPLIHPSVMFKKSKILTVGGYSETLKRRQDYELWFRCAEQGYQFANLPQALIQYRVTDDSLKRNSLSVAWSQYKIGLRGVSSLRLGFKARLGVAFPVIKALLPTPLRKLVIKLANFVDPRGRKHA